MKQTVWLAVILCFYGGVIRADPHQSQDLYTFGLRYFLAHPPRMYGSGSAVEETNKRLAKRNRELYERMSREELIANFRAILCEMQHASSPAECDGEAMKQFQTQQDDMAEEWFGS